MSTEAKSWPFQKELEQLEQAGFIQRYGRGITGLPTYVWTEEGYATFRYRMYPTPMSYAEAAHQNTVRHCVVCLADCYRKKVGAADGKFRVICLTCHAKGHGLLDLARNEEERKVARDIEHEWEQINAHARKFRYPSPKYLRSEE